MNFIEKLNWRYATKRMNGAKISQEKLNTILEAIRLAPTSMGLQPFKVLVIENQDLKEKIFNSSAKQPQIKECSHILVFATLESINESTINSYMATIAEERNVGIETLDPFKGMISGFVNNMPAEQVEIWAQKQVYIAFGFGLFAAALEEIDATPMEGFNPAQLDLDLDLASKGLKSCLIMTLGHRDTQNDYLVNAKKVRKSSHNFIEHIG